MGERQTIDRILRALDTDLAVENGPALARAYNEAVTKANTRAESIVEMIEHGQVSEALRQMDEEPPLLEAAGSLEFVRLPEWADLCARKGLPSPVPLNQRAVERILRFADSAEIVESSLKNYRRATRLGDAKGALQSLRHLIDKDASQDWLEKCKEAEKVYGRRLAEELARASERRDDNRVLELAVEMVETKWLSPPSGESFQRARDLIAGIEKKKIAREVAENVKLLKECKEKEWRPRIVRNLVSAMDALVKKGVALSLEDREVVESCRARDAAEQAAAAREAQWKEACEALHAAIERENPGAVREALANTVFLDKEPTEDLMRAAQDVLAHEAETRRRRALSIVVCVVLGVLACVGISAALLRTKTFEERCVAAAQALEKVKNASHAIEGLRSSLGRLKERDPEIYARPEIQVYEEALAGLIETNLARTNNIASVLLQLKDCQTKGWKDVSEKAIAEQFALVDKLLKEEDGVYRAEKARLKNDWTRVLDDRREESKKTAKSLHAHLDKDLRALAAVFQTHLASAAQQDEAEKLKGEAEHWKTTYASHYPTASLDDALKALAEAQQAERNLRGAIDALNKSTTVTAILRSRKDLRKHYASYEEVKRLGELPFEEDEALNVLAGKSPRQKLLAEAAGRDFAEADFHNWLGESVVANLEDFPMFWDLWCVQVGDELKAIVVGRPEIREVVGSGRPKVEITSEPDCLLKFGATGMDSQAFYFTYYGLARSFQMKTNDEVKRLIDWAKDPQMTKAQFANKLLNLLKDHFAEFDTGNAGKAFYPSYKRVSMMGMYMEWLVELGEWPQGEYFNRVQKRLRALTAQIHFSAIPGELAWACDWDPRVKDRNKECRKFLADNQKRWPEEVRLARFEASARRELRSYKVVECGLLAFKPEHESWKKDPASPFPVVFPSASKEAPLYVMRKEKGSVVLRRAFTRGDGIWYAARDMMGSYLTGEPLFQIETNGNRVDARKEVEAYLKRSGLPKDRQERFLRDFIVP